MRLTGKNATRQGTTIGFPKAIACYWKLKDYEDIEDELGLPLKIWIYLVQKDLIKEERIYVSNSIDGKDERRFLTQINGRPQRFILEIDFEKKFIRLQGTEEWCKMPFSDYGKTWALTREELQ